MLFLYSNLIYILSLLQQMMQGITLKYPNDTLKQFYQSFSTCPSAELRSPAQKITQQKNKNCYYRDSATTSATRQSFSARKTQSENHKGKKKAMEKRNNRLQIQKQKQFDDEEQKYSQILLDLEVPIQPFMQERRFPSLNITDLPIPIKLKK